jgi:peroxiredoxin
MDHEELARNLRIAYLAARDADAPLNARLAQYTRALDASLPTYAHTVERLIGRLTAAGSGSGAPSVGEQLPDFLLPDAIGRLMSLADILRDGPVAVVFLRGHWCPYCRMTAHALGRIEDQVRPLGRRIIVLTPERQAFSQKLLADADATFSILTDAGNGYALSLNLVIWLGHELSSMLTEYGRDLPLYQGDQGWFVPIPATFVLSSDGIITSRCVDPDYRQRMDSEALVAALKLAS